ncbi:MAG: histidine kinase [Rhizobacter sp.]|nr:histidine kinase [Ferruginibacter sp.]
MKKTGFFVAGVCCSYVSMSQTKLLQILNEPHYWWPISLLLIALLLVFLFNYYRKVVSLKQQETRNKELEIYKTAHYRHQLEMEQVINYFTHSIYSHHTTEDTLWDVTKNCISKLGFEDCVIYLVGSGRKVLVQKAAWGPKTTEENKILNPLEIPIGTGIVGSVAETGKAEIINDTSTDKRYIIDDQQRFAEICVPIIQQGNVIGVIDCEHSKKGFYSQSHLQIMETIAALCADRLQKIAADTEIRSKELHLASLKESLAASQLTALRAQMNPHFIFNALNSVQQYILSGDVDQANRYLTKFSRLQREVLNHCDQHFISLEKEIEMLQGYLEFEQLRFSENFNYCIFLENNIDPSEIKIPPMILQPYVENAIWHGLMPGQGNKEIRLEFSLTNEHILNCTIKDNGIGVAASKRLKQNNINNGQHPSKGLSLVSERLKILEQQYNQPFRAAITDILDNDNQVKGTCINLQIFIGDEI